MQIVETVRQWSLVQSYLRKLEALGPAAMAELARDNAIPEADLRQLAARSETDSALLPRLLKRLGIDPEQLAHRQASVLRVRPGTHDARAMRRIRTMAAAA